ncbi:MAG: 30S ribosomal protein S5 [Patescibacteria group bacterium]
MTQARDRRAADRHRSPDRRQQDEFDQKMIDIARVTRVMAGGKRMSFRACIVVGDRRGRVGMGLRKGADVSSAINKAVRAAKKNLVTVTMVNDTIPSKVQEKFGAALIILKPAPAGTGVIASGPVRAVLELAGVKNVVSKMLGSKNKVNNVMATLNALQRLKDVRQLKTLRS